MATIQRESPRDAVRGWQLALSRLGHPTQPDGLWGPRTEAATRALQRAHGLPATGVADDATQALDARPVLVQPATAFDEQSTRWAMVERALAVVGLGAAAPAPYLDLIAPCRSDRANEALCSGLLQMSGCALVVRGLWVRAGILPPVLTQPYRVGRAVADVVQVAREAGALRHATEALKPGHVVIVSGPEHVLTVTQLVPAGARTLVRSVDGGQRDAAGRQQVQWRERMLEGASLGGRPILHVVDAVALARHWWEAPGG